MLKHVSSKLGAHAEMRAGLFCIHLSGCNECIAVLRLYYNVCCIFNDAVDLVSNIFVIGPNVTIDMDHKWT